MFNHVNSFNNYERGTIEPVAIDHPCIELSLTQCQSSGGELAVRPVVSHTGTTSLRLPYTVVTMTTVGYGNQYPQLAITRFLAVLVMVFSSLYLSMPLALMGNEYVEVLSELDEAKKRGREAIELRLEGFEAIQSMYHMNIDELLSLTETSIPLTDLEEKLQRIKSHHLMVYARKLKELST